MRAHLEAKAQQLHLVIRSEMRLTLPGSGAPHARLVVLAQTRRGYGNLANWITVARRRAEEASYVAHPGDVEGKVPNAPTLAGLPECIALLVPSAAQPFEDVFAHAMWLKTWFRSAAIALALPSRRRRRPVGPVARRKVHRLPSSLPARHVSLEKALQDTLTATRLSSPSPSAARAEPNAEQHLRSRGGLSAALYERWPRTRWPSPACSFRPRAGHEYLQEIVPLARRRPG